MKITVITVCYNSASTIVDTVRSIAAQTHADIEHLVIDGGSTDATLELIAEHAAGTARVVSEPDDGIYDAMNKGLRLATGELIGFLNSDDLFATPDALAAVARAAAAQGADAVYGNITYFNPARANPLVRYWHAGSYAHAKLRLGWMPPHPSLYVRRAVFDRVGMFDAKLRIAGDYEFMLRLFSQPALRVAYVPEVLVDMRVGGASQRSLHALLQKSREDLLALRRHRVGGVFALLCKNLRKVPMFFARPPAGTR
jgi:glycosyltransferase